MYKERKKKMVKQRNKRATAKVQDLGMFPSLARGVYAADQQLLAAALLNSDPHSFARAPVIDRTISTHTVIPLKKKTFSTFRNCRTKIEIERRGDNR